MSLTLRYHRKSDRAVNNTNWTDLSKVPPVSRGNLTSTGPTPVSTVLARVPVAAAAAAPARRSLDAPDLDILRGWQSGRGDVQA